MGEYAFDWGFILGAIQPKGGGEVTRYRYKALRVLKRAPDGTFKVHRTMWNEAPPRCVES